mmetsp:Transcript_26316/g.62603  ORF Transcript_26316/g.62603 Transcript_26316/m.62603 type:complete len:632 (-) Transcript_26316:294-2189(-)
MRCVDCENGGKTTELMLGVCGCVCVCELATYYCCCCACWSRQRRGGRCSSRRRSGGGGGGGTSSEAVNDDTNMEDDGKTSATCDTSTGGGLSVESSSSLKKCYYGNKVINTSTVMIMVTMLVAAGVVGLLVATCTRLLKSSSSSSSLSSSSCSPSPSPSSSSSIGRLGIEHTISTSNLAKNYNNGENNGLLAFTEIRIVRDRSSRAGTSVNGVGAKTTRTTMNAKIKKQQTKNKKIMKNIEVSIGDAVVVPKLPAAAAASKTKGSSSSTSVLVEEDSTTTENTNLLRLLNEELHRRIRDLEVSNSHLRQRLSKMTQERNSWKSQSTANAEAAAKSATTTTTTTTTTNCQEEKVLADKTKNELDQKDRIIQYLSSALSIKNSKSADHSARIDTSKKNEDSKSTTTAASYNIVSEDNVKDGKNAIVTKPSIAMIPVLPPKQRPITSPMKSLSESSSSSSSSSSFPASPPESWSSRFSKSALSTFWNGAPMASTGVDSLYLWQRYLPSSMSSSSSSASSSSSNATSHWETGTMKQKMPMSKNQSHIFDQQPRGKLSMLGSIASKALAFYSKSTGLDMLETQSQEKNDQKVIAQRSKMEPSMFDHYHQGHHHDHKNQKSVITVGSKAVMATAGPN